MKNFIVTILSVFYLATAIGVTVHFHYCMGKLVDIDLCSTEENICSKCGMKKSDKTKGCCQNKYQSLKTNEHKQSKCCNIDSKIHSQIPEATISNLFTYRSFFWVANIPNNVLQPIIYRKCLIFIKYRNLRI